MNILAISGSLKSTSSNTALLHCLEELAPQNYTITIFEGLDKLPHFSPEIDTAEPLAAVATLRKAIDEADAVIISTPEYAFGIPGSLKNMLDWTVSSGNFNEKPAAVISASPLYGGGENALAALILTLQKALGAGIKEEAKLSIPNVYQKLKDGQIIDEELKDKLKQLLNNLTK